MLLNVGTPVAQMRLNVRITVEERPFRAAERMRGNAGL
jgi:hypothetical protein